MGPTPPDVTTRRYMVLRKATAATEAGVKPSATQPSASEDSTSRRMRLVSETMRPSSRGRRYKNSGNGLTMMDGPFAETKELIGGYVIVSAESLDEAGEVAAQYIKVVEADEVDVRELE